MSVDYKEGDDIANIEVLKKEFFEHAQANYHTPSHEGYKVKALSASAYASLVLAQAALVRNVPAPKAE
jgi:hypothetical protein